MNEYRRNANEAELLEQIRKLKWKLERAKTNHSWRKWLQDRFWGRGWLIAAALFTAALSYFASPAIWSWAMTPPAPPPPAELECLYGPASVHFGETEHKAAVACIPGLAESTDGCSVICSGGKGERWVVDIRQ